MRLPPWPSTSTKLAAQNHPSIVKDKACMNVPDTIESLIHPLKLLMLDSSLTLAKSEIKCLQYALK